MSKGDHRGFDEMLSAYLDGMLDEEEAKALEQRIEGDPESGRRLARMARNDRMLRRHFGEAGDRRVPESMAALLAPAPATEDQRRPSVLGRLSAWLAVPAPLRIAGAVAAVAVVGIGVFAMLGQGTMHARTDGGAALVQALPSTDAGVSRFLDRQPSGRAASIGEGARAMVDMSFKHADGRYCRQYRVALRSGSDGFAAVACRSGDDWQEVLAQRIDAPVADSGMFQAASGQASSVVDGYILEHMTGDIIVGEPEAELIEGDWSHP